MYLSARNLSTAPNKGEPIGYSRQRSGGTPEEGVRSRNRGRRAADVREAPAVVRRPSSRYVAACRSVGHADRRPGPEGQHQEGTRPQRREDRSSLGLHDRGRPAGLPAARPTRSR